MESRFGTSDGTSGLLASSFMNTKIGDQINDNKTILGGAESAGLSIKGHYPEKDGLVACLLAAEAVAARSASLTEELNALDGKIGRLESGRIGVALTPEVMSDLPERLKRETHDIGGRVVSKTNRIDGVQFIFADGSRVTDASIGNGTTRSDLCRI
jgi:phosphomannomutase